MLRTLINDIKYIKSKKIIQEKKLSEHTKQWLLSYFYWCTSISQAVYSYKNNIKTRPICKYNGCDKTQHYNKSTKYSSGCSHNHTTKINLMGKYGVDHNTKIKKIKKKIKKTNLKRYGSENFFGSEKFKNDIMRYNRETYGVDHNSQREDVKENIKKSNLNKYGVTSTLHSEMGKQKSKSTWLQKYGVDHFAKSDIISKKKSSTRKEKFIIKFLKNIKDDFQPLFDIESYDGKYNTYSFICKMCNNQFDFLFTANHIYPRCPKCNPIKSHAILESDIFNFINSDNKQQSNRKILKGKELDIYLPDHNLAIEFNGIYWHSELNGKNRNYHLNKTNMCEDKNIQLIHIFESEWIEKQNIIKSIINAKIGQFNQRIFARKCQIEEIPLHIKNHFLDENHLQGKDKSSIKIGLFHNNQLVSLMTFGKSRYNKNYEYEMHRFCSKKGYQIIGGASKLLKYFIKKYNPKSIITYANRRYSDGTFYEKIGFDKIGESKPNYFYFKGNSGLMSRLQFQKHKLKNKLESFDPELTEWENMQMNGYDRIWDCGNFKYQISF